MYVSLAVQIAEERERGVVRPCCRCLLVFRGLVRIRCMAQKAEKSEGAADERDSNMIEVPSESWYKLSGSFIAA